MWNKAATIVLAGGLLALAANAAVVRQGGDDLVPSGKGFGVHSNVSQQAGPALSTRATGINYHGGPVMLGTPTVYYILYGTWSSSSASLLADFASHLGGTPYFNIESTYWQTSSSGPHCSGQLAYGGSTSPGYSLGTNIDDNGIQTIVTNAISSGALPKNTNGVYLVVTSADVNETTGFCTQYCGWHTSGTILGSDIKFGFIGNPNRCPTACEGLPNNHPNNDTGVDGAVSIIAHEIDESVSDPDLNAWYDRSGFENGDKCAYNYGATYTSSNGQTANVHFGTRDWLIQQNWKNAGSGGCVLHYP